MAVWSKEAANPDTTLRNCTATFSVRIQTSLTMENCRLACFSVAYGLSAGRGYFEGPGPEFVRIVNSEFRSGRGSGMVFQSGGGGPIGATRIRSVHIENSTFHAPLRIAKAGTVTLLNNRFHGEVSVGQHATLVMEGNAKSGKSLALPGAGPRERSLRTHSPAKAPAFSPPAAGAFR